MISNNMNNIPSICVIMSVYNGERYLREAIESILNQTFTDFEFIKINDKSTDSSSKIISEFNDPRIIAIENSENIGLTKSLNKALKIASSDYIARMDCDDISLPKRFEIQKKFLDKNRDIVCVGSGTVIIDKNGNETGSKNPISDPELLRFYMILKNQMTHSSVMFRKEEILKNGPYDEKIKYAQDYDLWSRLLIDGYKFSNTKSPLLKYRFHNSSITQGVTKDKAYGSSQATVYKNISNYINCSENDFLIFIESLHQHRVDSLKQAFIAQNTLLKFKNAFLKIEKVSEENRKKISNYISTERIGAFKWYLMNNFGNLYKLMAKIKRVIKNQ